MGNHPKYIMRTKLPLNDFLFLISLMELTPPQCDAILLKSNLSADMYDFVLKNYMRIISQSDTYIPTGLDVAYDVEYDESLNSYYYINRFSKKTLLSEESISIFEIDLDRLFNWFRQQFDIGNSYKIVTCINPYFFHLGDCHIKQQKLSIYFGKQLSNFEVLEKIDNYLIKNPKKNPMLIITSSNTWLSATPKSKVVILSCNDLVEQSPDYYSFDQQYIINMIYHDKNISESIPYTENEVTPYIHCDSGGNILTVGNRNIKINGDKRKRVILAMVHFWQHGNTIISWDDVKETLGTYEGDPGATASAPPKFFGKKFLSEQKCIGCNNSSAWFTYEDGNRVHAPSTEIDLDFL